MSSAEDRLKEVFISIVRADQERDIPAFMDAMKECMLLAPISGNVSYLELVAGLASTVQETLAMAVAAEDSIKPRFSEN